MLSWLSSPLNPGKSVHKRLLIPGLMLAFSVPGILTAASAQAATATALPITSFYQIVADTSHSHLFISQGSSSENEILVTNLAGQPVGSIAGQDGVMGLALSPDGSTLYAALSADHAVTAISTATLQQTASYSLGDANTPRDVAVQSGRVWVSYDTSSGVGNAAIGDIDLSAATPGFQTQPAMGGWYSAPELAADPSDTGILVAVQPDEEPPAAATYTVSANPATQDGHATLLNCGFAEDLAVAPGGGQFVLPCGPDAVFRYSTADLSQQGSYASTDNPVAVAINGAGQVALGSRASSPAPDLYVYNAGGDAPLNSYNLETSGGDLAARGLAWSADAAQLFAVLGNSSDGSYALQVIDGSALVPATLTLNGPATATQATKPVTLTGKLSLPSGAPVADAAIAMTRSVSGGTSKTFAVTTAADGTYSLTDAPPAVGTYTYTASYAGNSTTAAATASTTVNVTGLPASLTVTTKSAVFTYKPAVQVTAHLGTTHGNRKVSIYAQAVGRTARTLLKTGTVNSSGKLTVTYAAAHSTTFSAVFSGDDRYASKTATHVIYVKARVSESLTGYYSHTRIRGTTYWRFHRRKLLHAHATVAPGKSGECVKFQAQEYYRGAWHSSVATPCLRLSSASKRSVPFTLTHADIGYHYRIRADYVRASTDTSNRSNDSAWRYFQVEK
jgi:Carboxypeptidase regulatory-like domain